MDSIVVAIIAGLAGTLTPLVTWLVFRQGSSDLRANLSRDVELRKSLDASDSEFVRELLRWNIENNATQLVHRERMRAHFVRANRFFAGAFCILLLGLVLANLAQVDALQDYKGALTLGGALAILAGIANGIVGAIATVIDLRAAVKTRVKIQKIADQHPFVLR